MIIDNATSSPIIIMEHDNVTMKCQARGRPIPHIAWYRRSEDGKNTNNKTRLDNQILANNTDGLFHLINISRYQSGHYECRASNGVNDHVVSKDIELRVLSRYRAQSKRRYPMSAQSFVPSFPSNNNNNNADGDELQERDNDDSWFDSIKVTTSTLTSMSQHKANEEQIEQFARLLVERLNLKETPNVTMNVNDDIGFPSSIFKQLEQQAKQQQRLHDYEENSFYRKQKVHDELMPTAERAILPGDYIPNHTCQRQLSVKLNLANSDVQNIDCFRFTKESKSLPTNQVINDLRLYIRRNYFHLNEQQGEITPDMFQIYQIFRPTSNDTTLTPPAGLTETIRLSVSRVGELNGNWFELTIKPNDEHVTIQKVYNQLIMPLYALAIDRDLQPSSNRHYYRQYHSKKHISYSMRSDNDDENGKQSQQQLPYMLVEYGDKIYPSSSGRRGTRDTIARPARGCHSTSSCCRRSLTIDLDQGSSALNFVIYPRQLDIGECVGVCGTSGSSLKHADVKNAQHRNEHNSAYNLLLLQNSLHFNRSGSNIGHPSDQHSTQCCSYSRTGGLELMYTTTNGGPIIRKFIPNMVVEEFIPSIRAQSTLIHGTIGKSTHLRCSATAPYDTLLYWRRIDNHNMSSQSNRFRQQQNIHGHLLHTTLYIKDVEKTDFGLYACYAESKAGQSKAVIELKVHHRSTITTTTTATISTSVVSHILEKNQLIIITTTTTTIRAQLLKRNKISDQTANITKTNFASSLFISYYLLILIMFFLYL
ncbi:unnamed protein product [Rotaria sp. Silwood1]|nr:unnamed protein product [Rotaria sp. Silwood1]